jgi:prepilin-type N-terminal cleavage/methylation domain-containing protein/prepilin-type processing-associated H-X9-DG protein
LSYLFSCRCGSLGWFLTFSILGLFLFFQKVSLPELYMNRQSQRRGGFTLIELLVVIAIIAVLIGLLLPAVQKVREAANRMQCQNNLKQLALAMVNLEGTKGRYPAWGFDFLSNPNPANPFGAQTQGHSMLAMVLPYIEQGNLNNIFDVNKSVADPANLPAPLGVSTGGATKVKTFVCPSAPDRTTDYGPYFGVTVPLNLAAADYAAIKGLRGPFQANCAPASPTGDSGFFGARGKGNNDGPRQADIIDGTSNTIMLTEIAGRQQVYAKGKAVMPNNPGSGGWQLNGAWADHNITKTLRGWDSTGMVPDGGCSCINVNNFEAIYGFHTAGVNAAFGDGSVRFLKESTDSKALAAAITRQGGEVLTLD